MAGRLCSKVALITGASSGMGAEEAKLFMEEGANVIATDINYELLKKTFDGFTKEIDLFKLDVSNNNDWIKVIGHIKNKYGKLDILVNNAGIYIPHSFQEFTIELWNKTLNVNALGTMLGIQNAIPLMQEQSQGSIVNIASVDANIGTGNSYIYTASKGAVRSLTKKLAVEFAGDNIRINSIHPGLVSTPMTYEQINSEAGSHAQFNTPLNRIAKPLDIAYGALYLASDESSYMTGTELIIDGGLSAL